MHNFILQSPRWSLEGVSKKDNKKDGQKQNGKDRILLKKIEKPENRVKKTENNNEHSVFFAVWGKYFGWYVYYFL